MAAIRIPKGWELPASAATPERVYLNRRRFLKRSGLLGLGAVAMAAGCGKAPAVDPGASPWPPAWNTLYPAQRNGKYTLDRPLTAESVAAMYNNFYEFTSVKSLVAKTAAHFPSYPWTVEVTGLVRKPRVWDIDAIVKAVPLEERLYRHRCVEAWAMAVPWTGIPLAAFIEKVEPLSSAKFVRMVSFDDPARALGQAQQSWYPWPYYEGLSLAEATNELALLATGIYGHPLPMQHGAPIRLVTPWKYGFKSIKSIVRMEFVDRQPPTFWNDVTPDEYGFVANVEPDVPHPRWSQATERMIGTGERLPTRLYNGYAAYVASLYA